MILYYSSHLCIFNGDGFQKEKLLLLKMFNNYSIKRFLKIIQKLKKGLFLTFDLKLYIKKKIKIFLSDILLTLNINEEKNFINFIIKKFIAFFFIKIYKILINQKNLRFDIFNELERNNNLLKQNISSKQHALYIEEIPKYLSTEGLMTYKLFKKLNFSFKLKKEIYKKEYSFFSKFAKNVNNINNQSILVIGEGCDLYPGTFTPFISSKFNWFVSTGLKTDIECNFLDPFDQVDPIEALILDNERTPGYENIIFKVNNFKRKVINKIKKTERNPFLYSINNNYGIKSFTSEVKTTFNLKINNLFIFNQNYLLEKINYNYIYNNLNYSLSKNFNLFKINKLKFFDNYNRSLNIKREKFYFILFKLSKSILDYYLLLINGLNNDFKECFDFYRSLVFFIHINKNYIVILKELLSSILTDIFHKDYKLKLYKKFYIYNSKYINDIFHIYFFNMNYIKKIQKYITKFSFFNIFFDIFLVKKKKVLLKNKQIRTTDKLEKILISYRLLKKYTWFNFSKFTWHYITFLLEWRINFNFLINDNKKNIAFKYLKESQALKDNFKNLKEKWYDIGKKSLKEFYFFFLSFIENLATNVKKMIYFELYLNININKRFFLLNLYLYLNKLINKDFFLEKISLSSTISLSSIFLGKWFYYRQIHKFFDNNIDYNYSLIRKPPRFLNSSILESNYYNLQFLNKNKNLNLNNKLDSYFFQQKFKDLTKIKLNLETKDIKKIRRTLKKQDTYFNIKTEVKKHIDESIYLFRKTLWFKRFTNSYDNFLKINYRVGLPILKGGVLTDGTRKRFYSQVWQKWQKLTITCQDKNVF